MSIIIISRRRTMMTTTRRRFHTMTSSTVLRLAGMILFCVLFLAQQQNQKQQQQDAHTIIITLLPPSLQCQGFSVVSSRRRRRIGAVPPVRWQQQPSIPSSAGTTSPRKGTRRLWASTTTTTTSSSTPSSNNKRSSEFTNKEQQIVSSTGPPPPSPKKKMNPMSQQQQSSSSSAGPPPPETAPTTNRKQQKRKKMVLIAGFESFNRDLYERAGAVTMDDEKSDDTTMMLEVQVFADSDIRLPHQQQQQQQQQQQGGAVVNPKMVHALQEADAVLVSLLFDYDDVQAILPLLAQVKGPRLIFESATELMELNKVNSFSMMPNGKDGPSGPPPAVKKVLSLFGSSKEEDKLNGYLKLLKVGPTLLQYVPGEKAQDLRAWLEAYRYWNQGGTANVRAMLQLVSSLLKVDNHSNEDRTSSSLFQDLPPLQVTPDIGLIHPLLMKDAPGHRFHFSYSPQQPNYMESPSEYLKWRLSPACQELAMQQGFPLAQPTITTTMPESHGDGRPVVVVRRDPPKVAVLLYRKHVITQQRYILDLITQMESQGLLPIPIFINGVEAHTIVRDWLTSTTEQQHPNQKKKTGSDALVAVDAIVNTIGFPLVGGPAGSMEAGRNVAVAQELLASINVPYVVAAPLLLQSIRQWKDNGVLGLQSVVLYSLPELDGAIDSVVLGGLVPGGGVAGAGGGGSSSDHIALIPERVRKLCGRLEGWIRLRQTPPQERKIAIALYGFPPNVGAVGTAALLDVPRSLDQLLGRLVQEGYDLGDWGRDDAISSGESLVAALAVLSENSVISTGVDGMQAALESKMERARQGDSTIAATLALPDGGGLAGAKVRGRNMSWDELENMLGKYMTKKVQRAWSNKERGPGVSSKGDLVVAGLQLGNVWIFVQPLLGVEGDPMRLLFERDLTPHPQYCATYQWLRRPEEQGGFGAQSLIHFGMHGTVEWLPGQPLGNDRPSWSDELLGSLPNLYVYAANNPSESILAKRRGYGTLVSYNVPPYGRSGLYLELANLKELVEEFRTSSMKATDDAPLDVDVFQMIYDLAERNGMTKDVPLHSNPNDPSTIVQTSTSEDGPPFSAQNLSKEAAEAWVLSLSEYLNVLQDRLFSSGLHVFGSSPTDDELVSYLEAYYGDRLSPENCRKVVDQFLLESLNKEEKRNDFLGDMISFVRGLFDDKKEDLHERTGEEVLMEEATSIVQLLARSTEEIDSVLEGLSGGYIRPAPGGDLLRDGPSVLPTGRNIHALDPYRMPSASAWIRGQKAAEEILRQHKNSNGGKYPETVAVTLWGLDAIKTRGESVAIVLALVGAEPVKEGTGRVVRYDLIPLEDLKRPRVDVLASLSGIFRDSFANIVDLLDDMFERAAQADEPSNMNYIKKHVQELVDSGVNERPAARLFSNPPGDYGSMVNEVVGTGEWEDSASLGETWKGRNVFSYGRNEGNGQGSSGTARPAVLDKLLSTTERVVQEVDSVEYGISDIQEYYANTGALKKAAENRKEVDPATGKKKKVTISVIEAFGNTGDDSVPVKDVEEVLRLEYRSKFLNPKWRDAMMKQGSGGAYEISQRMTAMVGWAATAEVDNFVFDQAAERYALDEDIAAQLQKSNPEAFKNVLRRLLEAAGRGMWSTDEDTLEKLRSKYMDADDLIEEGSSRR